VVLVESRRVEGKPRQRVIAYLGAYEDDDRDDPRARREFWHDVRAALDGLRLDAAFRQRLEAQIAARIPPATTEECAREQALKREWDYLRYEEKRVGYWTWRDQQATTQT
jgi:hypothetical protein